MTGLVLGSTIPANPYLSVFDGFGGCDKQIFFCLARFEARRLRAPSAKPRALPLAAAIQAGDGVEMENEPRYN